MRRAIIASCAPGAAACGASLLNLMARSVGRCRASRCCRPTQHDELSQFFTELGTALSRVLVPGAHVFIASNPLLSTLAFHALQRAGLEKRGEVVRLVQTLRGGDRPKGAETAFPDVSVMARSGWEPWGIFRKPVEGTVAENLRRWGTGGLRRISEHGAVQGCDRECAYGTGGAGHRGASFAEAAGLSAPAGARVVAVGRQGLSMTPSRAAVQRWRLRRPWATTPWARSAMRSTTGWGARPSRGWPRCGSGKKPSPATSRGDRAARRRRPPRCRAPLTHSPTALRTASRPVPPATVRSP